MLAYQMNGEQSPLLNGFTLRLIVPGWYSTYWVKMLNDVEVLNPPEELLNEDGLSQSRKPYASVKPSESAFRTVPINRMVPRSFFTNVSNNPIVKPAAPVPVRGIAFDEVVVQVTPGCEVMIDEWARTFVPAFARDK